MLHMASVVYAYAAYHGNWAEQPYLGNWWWYNGTYLDWDVDDLWTPAGANALRSGHNIDLRFFKVTVTTPIRYIGSKKAIRAYPKNGYNWTREVNK
jgi:hypothetical protein